MKPRDLEKKVKGNIEKLGYLVDQAFFNVKHLPGGRIIANKVDFAHVFDLIAYKQDMPILLIQVCLKNAVPAHQKKIDSMFKMHSCPQFRVILVAVSTRPMGKRTKYLYTMIERYEKEWVTIDTL